LESVRAPEFDPSIRVGVSADVRRLLRDAIKRRGIPEEPPEADGQLSSWRPWLPRVIMSICSGLTPAAPRPEGKERCVRLPHEFVAPVRTARLVLRAMTPGDVNDIHAYQSRSDVCRYLPFEPRNRDEVAEKVAKYSKALVLSGDGDFWQLAIERAADPGRVIGDVYFTIKNMANATCEIGWTLHPDHAGLGYMTEAAGAVLEIAFNDLGLHRASAVLDPRNDASAALCRRLGMRAEAYFVEEMWFKGAWADTAIYAILDREWAARAASESAPRPRASPR
jgi:RimJ/RimL family protein N-acetyltransferase